jgi:hypothetical protein
MFGFEPCFFHFSPDEFSEVSDRLSLERSGLRFALLIMKRRSMMRRPW